MYIKNEAVVASLKQGVAIQDDQDAWREMVQYLKISATKVLALRGAGSVNGIHPVDEQRLLQTELFPRVAELLDDYNRLAIMYDGDDDCPNKPDIGSIMGRLADHFSVFQNRLLLIAVQKQGWYSPPAPGLNLENQNGVRYVTFVFPDGKYPGDHDAFSQAAELVESPNYQQWYVGASGAISQGQLLDYNTKVPIGQRRKATFFKARNNPTLDEEIKGKLNLAIQNNDAAKIQRLESQLVQRKQIFGVHWDNEGNPLISSEMVPGLELVFVS